MKRPEAGNRQAAAVAPPKAPPMKQIRTTPLENARTFVQWNRSNIHSCFPKPEHGAVAGVILFFTCLSAVVGPLAMGAVSDAMGGPRYGFMLAIAFAALLFVGLLINWIFDPTREVLHRLDATEYR
jgi:hypothetical protein